MTFDRRIFNFAPGPATLPEEVLAQAGKDILNWQGLGMGVMEVSHRGKPFMACYEEAVADLRASLTDFSVQTPVTMKSALGPFFPKFIKFIGIAAFSPKAPPCKNKTV